MASVRRHVRDTRTVESPLTTTAAGRWEMAARGMSTGARGAYDSESEGSEGSVEEDVGLTENQQRLLFLISLHSSPAKTADDEEHWVRDGALMVLIYEGVVAQVLDYDYAPASLMVEGQRMYFNVSQEGRSDLDYLREEQLVNGLKISSRQHLPVTMYQISRKGTDVLRSVDQYDRDAINSYALSPAGGLLSVDFDEDDGSFWLSASAHSGGRDVYRRRSSVLDIEEVSYVSSAYIPACLRHGGRPTLSNAHRVHECTNAAAGTIRDDLEEIITLNSVSLIVGEYIPFGTNAMVRLNTTLGSPERVLGGFYTAAVMDDSASAAFKMPPGLTAVQILDYSLAGHVNFEADIQLPEPEGIVQIETFGVSLHSNGACFYGLQLEAVMDRVKDAISLDHLSRLLVDVQTDSSEIVEPMLSPAQRRAIDLVFKGDVDNRNKVNLIIANEMTPHLSAEEYMDKGEFENELKQVLGDTRAAYDISDADTLIFGANGLLLAGPNSRQYEPLLASYVQLLSMDMFAQNLYSVIFVVQDDVRALTQQCRESRRDPVLLRRAIERLPVTSRRVLTLEKVVAFMEESLLATQIPEAPLTAAGRALYERLSLPQLQSEMARRVTDVSKFVRETMHEVKVLERAAEQVQRERDRDILRTVETNLISIKEAGHPRELSRMTHLLTIMTYSIMGLLMFASLDRLTGDWTVVSSDWFRTAATALLEDAPTLWFFLSFFVFAIAGGVIYWRVNRRDHRMMEDITRVHLEVRQTMDQNRLQNFLAPKRQLTSSWGVDMEGDRVMVSWLEEVDVLERWGGSPPVITIVYSAQLSEMLSVAVEYRRNNAKTQAAALSPQDLRDRVIVLLEKEFILMPDDNAPELVMGPSELAAVAQERRDRYSKTVLGDIGREDVAPAVHTRIEALMGDGGGDAGTKDEDAAAGARKPLRPEDEIVAVDQVDVGRVDAAGGADERRTERAPEANVTRGGAAYAAPAPAAAAAAAAADGDEEGGADGDDNVGGKDDDDDDDGVVEMAVAAGDAEDAEDGGGTGRGGGE